MADQDWQTRLKTGRNDDCPCGSKKKYKKCHLEADEKAKSEALTKINAEAAEKVKAEGNDHEGHDHSGHDHPHGHGHSHERTGIPKPHAPVNAQKQVNAPRKTGAA